MRMFSIFERRSEIRNKKRKLREKIRNKNRELRERK